MRTPERKTRKLVTPGGQPHLITLNPRWWEVFDYLVQNGFERGEAMIGFAWRFVSENEGEQLDVALEYYLHLAISEAQMVKTGRANDNRVVSTGN